MLDFYRLVWLFERGFNNSTRLVFAVLHLHLARARSGSGPRRYLQLRIRLMKVCLRTTAKSDVASICPLHTR